jgi:hypothetical protein
LRAIFHSINGRIFLIPIIALLALIVAGLASIHMIADITLQEHQARARAVTEAATKIVDSSKTRLPAVKCRKKRPNRLPKTCFVPFDMTGANTSSHEALMA